MFKSLLTLCPPGWWGTVVWLHTCPALPTPSPLTLLLLDTDTWIRFSWIQMCAHKVHGEERKRLETPGGSFWGRNAFKEVSPEHFCLPGYQVMGKGLRVGLCTPVTPSKSPSSERCKVLGCCRGGGTASGTGGLWWTRKQEPKKMCMGKFPQGRVMWVSLWECTSRVVINQNLLFSMNVTPWVDLTSSLFPSVSLQFISQDLFVRMLI